MWPSAAFVLTAGDGSVSLGGARCVTPFCCFGRCGGGPAGELATIKRAFDGASTLLVSPKTVGGGMARLTQVDELADSGGGFRCVRIVASGNVVESCIPDLSGLVFSGREQFVC